MTSASHTFTALDAVCGSGITIASDGAEYNKIGEFDPVDATSNPSLVYAAVNTPEYAHLVADAVKYSQIKIPSATLAEKTELAMDRLVVQVGAHILSIIPGRVSISVDPRLSSSYPAILTKSRGMMALVDELGIPRSRILIKIPATAAGIHAAHTLEAHDGIHTNLTLVFGLVQALACAQAGVSVISPFVGRVKDWWAARAVAEGTPRALEDQPLAEHPGLNLVCRIREAYRRHGYATQVMAAGFRTPEEVVELARAGNTGGPDLVTLPPELLRGLRDMPGDRTLAGGHWTRASNAVDVLPPSAPVYFTSAGPTPGTTAGFSRASREEMISLDKVPEGLAKFSADTGKLEDQIRVSLEMEVRQLSSTASLSQSEKIDTENRDTRRRGISVN